MTITNLNIKERLERFNVTGLSVSVIENAKIECEEYYGLLERGTDRLVTSNSIFSACSMSKFVTGVVVIILGEQGVVDLDEDINNKLTSWKLTNNLFTKNKKVTLRNLLCHQSGIVDPEDSFINLRLNDEYPSMVDLLNGVTDYCKTPIHVNYEPESEFHYSDAGYCIIQLLIEDVMGKRFEHLVDELIFQPLNMQNSTYKITRIENKNEQIAYGYNKRGELVKGEYAIYPYPAAAGLWTTPSDFSILVIELINSLKGNSKIGLSLGGAKDIVSPQGSKEWTGLGLFLDERNGKLEISSLGWGVGYQCMMVAYPYLESGIIIMTNTDLGVHQIKGIIGEIYESYCTSLEK